MTQATKLLSALLAMTLSARAQLAPGEVIVSSGSNGEPGQDGTYIADRSGSVSHVTGLIFPSFDGILVDPIDGKLWMNSPGALYTATLSGRVATSHSLVVLLGLTEFIRQSVFDEDSNLIMLATETTTGQGQSGLYRIDRISFARTRSLFGTVGLLHGGLAIHPTTNALYVTQSSFSVLEFLPPYTGSPRVVGNLNPLSQGMLVTGACFAPIGPQGSLLFSMISSRILRLDLASGSPSILASYLGIQTRWMITADRRQGDYWLHENDPVLLGRDSLLTIDSSGRFTHRANLGPIGQCYGLAVNDYLPGTLNIAPMHVTGSAFLLEVGLWGPPGDLAVLAITRPVAAPILLGAGVFDRGGNFHVKIPIPAGAMGPGSPRRLEFTGAAIHLPTLSATVYPGKAWPKN